MAIYADCMCGIQFRYRILKFYLPDAISQIKISAAAAVPFNISKQELTGHIQEVPIDPLTYRDSKNP